MLYNILKKIWWSIILISFFLLAIQIPLRILYPGYNTSFLEISYWFINIFFIADTIYNFILIRKRVGSKFNDQLPDKFSIFLLFVDIVSAIPIGFIFGNLFFEIFRSVKVLRIIKYMRNINLEATRLSSYLSFLFFTYWFLLAVHFFTCGWIALDKTPINFSEEYVNSLYWCIQTITTVGYGDVMPPDLSHKIYAMVVMLFGVGVYGFVFGNITNILLKRNPARTQFLNNMEKLRSFVNFRKIPSGLQKRIRNYYEYIWRQKLGYNEEEFIAGLPEGLKTDVEQYLKRSILESIPLFKGISDSFLREVSLHLRPVVYTPGDYIFKQGDRGNEMYFLIKGKLKVLTGDKNRVLNTLSDGDFFGELALFKDQTRMATVQAVTYSDIYTLDKEAFEHVLNNYPEISSHIKKVAEERIDKTD